MATCADIDNFFPTEADRYSNQTLAKAWTTSVWGSQDVVPQTSWPDGMGQSINFLTFNRSMPLTNEPSFSTVTFNDGGEGDGYGSCNPPTVVVYPSHTTRAMTLKKAAIESQKICIEDGRMSWNLARVASETLRNLNGVVKYVWENQRRDQFTSVVSNKAIADGSMTTNASSFGVLGTIGEIKQAMLDYWYDRLTHAGAHENSGIPLHFGQPVLALVLSREAQKTLVTNSVTIENIRWSSDADRLNGPMGSFKLINGFAHMIDINPARWNLTGGAWVRVPFKLPATTAGDASDVNPLYYTAQYEDMYITTPHVLKFAIPGSLLQTSAGMTFHPQNYSGKFEWLNIRDNECNKDGNVGYFRAVLGYGAQPGIPEYGAVIRFRRCETNWAVSQCS